MRSPQSGFELPADPGVPMIMVGPGLGVAPVRGFLQARRALRDGGASLGPAHLYFGCRDPRFDYLYREEFEQAERDGLVTLHVAFSRVSGAPKTYVQELLHGDAAELIALYVCGDGTHMAPDVESALCAAFATLNSVKPPAAREWLDQLLAEGRYAKDVWTGVGLQRHAGHL